MKVAAIIGYSGSGKTTAIEGLIRLYIARGESVGAIKRTHHPLNEIDKGDTSRFRRAGAAPVILAREDEAVVFSSNGTSRIAFADPASLLDQFTTGVVLVEGFRHVPGWPQVELRAGQWRSAEEIASILDKIWRP